MFYDLKDNIKHITIAYQNVLPVDSYRFLQSHPLKEGGELLVGGIESLQPIQLHLVLQLIHTLLCLVFLENFLLC